MAPWLRANPTPNPGGKTLQEHPWLSDASASSITFILWHFPDLYQCSWDQSPAQLQHGEQGIPVCVCVCAHRNVRVFMCFVSGLTGLPAGGTGERKKNCSSPCPCLAGSCAFTPGGRGQTDSSNHDLPQDTAFDLADVILFQHGCSKASGGCIA